MAAELASDNHAILKQSVGGNLTGTDLYLAHFLGAQGASNFLNSMKKNPWAPAASLFPDAAHSNRGVFYDNGKPLSLQAVYNRFDAKFDSDDTPVTQVADTNSFAKKVVLPAADDWSNPNAMMPPRLNALGALAATTPRDDDMRIGGFLSSPVDVMLMAQSNHLRFEHEDNNRYNA